MLLPKYQIRTILICVVFLLSFKEEQPDDKVFNQGTPLAVYFKEKGLVGIATGKMESTPLILKKATLLF